MAKVLFISVNDTNAEGIRILSAVLKQNGHLPYIAFLKRHSLNKGAEAEKKPEKSDWVGIDKWGNEFKYAVGSDITETERQLLFSLIEEIKPDLIGFSVTSPLKNRIKDISGRIKNKYSIPIIWGGPDPALDPEDCLQFCDAVCVGEGEKAMLDAAGQIELKKNIRQASNIVYLSEGGLVRNAIHPLINDLDSLPFKDIDPKNKFLITDNLLIRDYNRYKNPYENRVYRIMTSRGCPFNCSYCCESFMKKLYFSEVYLRRRSVEHVINELRTAKETLGYDLLIFEDEVFSFDNNWLIDFKERYGKEIGVPYICYIYHREGIEKTLTFLKESGVVDVCLALQSGSAKINKEVFYRPFNEKAYLNTAAVLHKMGINYGVDIITYNPFESEDDLRATLSVLVQLPKPFGIAINKLYVMKNAPIYELIELRKKTGAATLPDKTFNYYARLFWLATMLDKFSIVIISRMAIFRSFPQLLTLIFLPFYLAGRMMKLVKHPSLLIKKLKRK